jgi:anaerobic magnesium-protoporphyrin IX monomethyl ester cyclase
MANYRRFYMYKSFFSYPFAKGDPVRRRYLWGCLKAFLKSAFERKFYDLGRAGYWGPQSKKQVNFHFDNSRRRGDDAMEISADWKSMPKAKQDLFDAALAARACGSSKTPTEEPDDSYTPVTHDLSESATMTACGGSKKQMENFIS